MEKRLIGSKERIDFPKLNIRHVVARIDTGATTSSVHCERIWIEKFDGKEVLCCHLLRKTTRVTRFKQFSKKKVRSSNGHVQTRYSVRMRVNLGGDEFRTDFTLSNRKMMKFSVLLGRRTLKGRYIVDVSEQYLLDKAVEDQS